MTERGMTFGAVASAYERYRPGYPEQVVDEVLAYAGRPVRTALEIGAGTGKATRMFAARGIAVTATDPDPAMLAELRRHVPPSVTAQQAALEDLAANTRYDLVFVAAALHWTRPEGRWERIGALLAPGGTFASLGGTPRIDDPELAEAIVAARASVVPDEAIASPDGTRPDAAMQWPGTELSGSPDFTDVRQVALADRIALTADDFVGYLSTVSAYLQLPASDRAGVLGRIRTVLPAELGVTADLTLHLARRV